MARSRGPAPEDERFFEPSRQIRLRNAVEDLSPYPGTPSDF
ncbi:hypothetical protein [Nitratifractor sp.]